MGLTDYLGAGIYGPALTDFLLSELVPVLDWSPFFHTWEMRGRYPDLLKDPVRGPAAQELSIMPRNCCRKSSTRSFFRPAPFTVFIPPTAKATTSCFTQTRRVNRNYSGFTRCASKKKVSAASLSWRSPTSSRRVTAAGSITSAPLP